MAVSDVVVVVVGVGVVADSVAVIVGLLGRVVREVVVPVERAVVVVVGVLYVTVAVAVSVGVLGRV
ncbi:MAG: hypothetical protein CMB58_000720 [Methanobacteriota archaeon]|nr:MAG: hypothetical protein CMB58_000720 [Euryarchaeota archaeon]